MTTQYEKLTKSEIAVLCKSIEKHRGNQLPNMVDVYKGQIVIGKQLRNVYFNLDLLLSSDEGIGILSTGRRYVFKLFRHI